MSTRASTLSWFSESLQAQASECAADAKFCKGLQSAIAVHQGSGQPSIKAVKSRVRQFKSQVPLYPDFKKQLLSLDKVAVQTLSVLPKLFDYLEKNSVLSDFQIDVLRTASAQSKSNQSIDSSLLCARYSTNKAFVAFRDLYRSLPLRRKHGDPDLTTGSVRPDERLESDDPRASSLVVPLTADISNNDLQRPSTDGADSVDGTSPSDYPDVQESDGESDDEKHIHNSSGSNVQSVLADPNNPRPSSMSIVVNNGGHASHRSHAAPSLTRPISHVQTLCFNDAEQHLFVYFIEKYCQSRTLYRDIRYNSLLCAIPPNPPRAFMAAVFCLASLYAGRPQETYFREVVKFLRERVQNVIPDSEIALIASVLRLLIQYHIVKREVDQTWIFHIKGFRSLQDKFLEHVEARSISVRIIYECILKFAPNLPDSEGPNGGLSIDYLLTLENPREIRDYGCSPEVLHLLGCINMADYRTRNNLSRRVELAYSLLATCKNIDQTTPETGERREAIKKTAESYVHLALVLIHWRLLNCASVSGLGNALGRCVLSIPAKGKLFTAQYPLASAFWAILFSPEYGQKCYDFLENIWTDRPTARLFLHLL